MRSLRVLHIIDHLGTGGAQQIIDDIVRHSPDGAYDYTVLYFFDRHRYRAELEARGVRVMCFCFGAYTYSRILFYIFHPYSYLRLIRFLRSEHFDIFHLHLFYAFIVTLIGVRLQKLWGRSLSARILYTMHAMKNQVPRFFIFLRILGRIPDVIVGDLPAMVEEMRAVHVPARRFLVIHTSTDFSDFPVTHPQELRRELGLSADARILVSVGRLHKQKGYHYFLAAMPKVLEQFPRAVALMVGDGEEMSVLRHLTRRLRLGASVRFLGFRADTARFYDAADVLVHPATEEALAIVVLDAMARGRAVIACGAGAIASVVRDGETGYLVERKNSEALADAIINCLENKFVCDQMGERAKRIVEECYRLDRFVAEYYALYRELVSQK